MIAKQPIEPLKAIGWLKQIKTNSKNNGAMEHQILECLTPNQMVNEALGPVTNALINSGEQLPFLLMSYTKALKKKRVELGISDIPVWISSTIGCSLKTANRVYAACEFYYNPKCVDVPADFQFNTDIQRVEYQKQRLERLRKKLISYHLTLEDLLCIAEIPQTLPAYLHEKHYAIVEHALKIVKGAPIAGAMPNAHVLQFIDLKTGRGDQLKQALIEASRMELELLEESDSTSQQPGEIRFSRPDALRRVYIGGSCPSQDANLLRTLAARYAREHGLEGNRHQLIYAALFDALQREVNICSNEFLGDSLEQSSKSNPLSNGAIVYLLSPEQLEQASAGNDFEIQTNHGTKIALSEAVVNDRILHYLACLKDNGRIALFEDPNNRFFSSMQRMIASLRQPHCAAPGCDATGPDLYAHHIKPYAKGGKTLMSNLILLCKKHHEMNDDTAEKIGQGHFVLDEWGLPAWKIHEALPCPKSKVVPIRRYRQGELVYNLRNLQHSVLHTGLNPRAYNHCENLINSGLNY